MPRPATHMAAWLGGPVLGSVLGPILGLVLGPILGLALAVQASAEVPLQPYQVVAAYPHDEEAFTQGLFILDGALFETTGLYPSTLRQVRLETGEVLRRRDLPTIYFGEGATALDGRIYSLTWRNRMGFIWGPEDFEPLGGFTYAGEGWGLTTDGRRLIMSDGTDRIRLLDPDTLAETGSIQVTADGRPLDRLNELEWVDGEILANVWGSPRIARIDPETGRVRAFIDLSALYPADADPADDVANGIAWDAEARRLFVTGKRWPKLYEIRLAD